MNYDLTILMLTLNEAGNIGLVIKEIQKQIQDLGVTAEILIIDGGSKDGTINEARLAGIECVLQTEKGYGQGLRQGFRLAKGRYLITLDADQSHPASLIREMWQARGRAEMLVASRFVPGGSATTSRFRYYLSRFLNRVFHDVLHIPVFDFSSGYRMYLGEILKPARYFSKNFDILPEILVKAFADGYTIAEIPLHYQPRGKGKSNANIIKYGLAFFQTLFRMWALRNSIESADYDHRAFDSMIPLQRYWQRKRHAFVLSYIDPSKSILDIGCGSSRIIQGLPNAVAMDLAAHKLRFLKSTNPKRVRASTFQLPFATEAFDQVIHSQVIEHIPLDFRIYRELNRVIKMGGILVIGTPDYGRPWWPMIEFFYDKILPNAYAHEHITHYTFPRLTQILIDHGFKPLQHRYICGAELIIQAQKINSLE